MKPLLALSFASALLVGACSKKSAQTTPDDTRIAPDNTLDAAQADPPAMSEGTPCAQEIAMACPEGQIDACLKTPPDGDTHRCVAK